MLKNIFYAIIIVFIIIVLGYISKMIYNYISYIKKTEYRIFPKIKLSDIRNTLKSGDIILYTALGHNIFNSMSTGSTYSHVGIVIELNGSLYTLEIYNHGDLYYKNKHLFGVQLVPLEERLQTYTGTICIMQLNKSLTNEHYNSLINFSKKYYNYDTNIINIWLRLLFHHSIFENKICMEHLAMAMSEAGITNQIYECFSLNIPNELDKLPYKKLESGYMYSEPQQILCDLL